MGSASNPKPQTLNPNPDPSHGPPSPACRSLDCNTGNDKRGKKSNDKCGSVASDAKKLAKHMTRATCACICMCACVYVCARVCPCVCARACVCVYVCARLCLYVCARALACVRVCACTCVRVCAGLPVCLCCGPQMLQWCAWRCAGVAFAEAGMRMCCCCCSLSVERAGASMVPRFLNSA